MFSSNSHFTIISTPIKIADLNSPGNSESFVEREREVGGGGEWKRDRQRERGGGGTDRQR